MSENGNCDLNRSPLGNVEKFTFQGIYCTSSWFSVTEVAHAVRVISESARSIVVARHAAIPNLEQFCDVILITKPPCTLVGMS